MEEEKGFKLNPSEMIILAAGLFIRIFSLGTIPSGVYIDEPPISYTAWCIANFGVDRYLRHMPVYFQNWYSGQSPMYTYLLAFLYKLGFPMGSPAVIRIPACIFSILIMMLVLVGVRYLSRDRYVRISALFLAAFAPYFVMQGRIGLDCNLLLFWSMFSLFFLVRFCREGKTKDLCISGLCFGLSLYTYALSYILMGIFLILCALYLLWTKKIDVKRTLLWALIVIAVSLPIILFAISVVFGIPEYTILGFTVAPVSAGRISELSGKDFVKNAVLSVLKSLTFDHHYALTLKEFGALYYLSIPFVAVGVIKGAINTVKSVIRREFETDALFILFVMSNAVVGGLNQDVLVYRINGVFAAYLYFCVRGMYIVKECIKKEKIKQIACFGVAGLYLCSSLLFAKYYFFDYTREHDGFVHSASEAIDYWQDNYLAGKLYVDYYDLPELILYEYPISPYEWSEGNSVLNITPHIPEIIEGDCGYILRKTNGSDRKLIEESGIEFVEYQFDEYILFAPQY